MKRFFQKYSYLMVKMFITQCVIGLFGNVLALAGIKSESVAMTVIIGIVAIAFYLFLLYTTVWEYGNKDKPAVDSGRMKFSPFTGILIGLGANIPNFLIATVHVALLPIAMKVEGTISAISGIARVVFLFINGMYSGIMSDGLFAEGFALHDYWFMFYLITIPAVIVTTIAYIMGVKEKHLTKILVPMNPEELEIKRNKNTDQK